MSATTPEEMFPHLQIHLLEVLECLHAVIPSSGGEVGQVLGTLSGEGRGEGVTAGRTDRGRGRSRCMSKCRS